MEPFEKASVEPCVEASVKAFVEAFMEAFSGRIYQVFNYQLYGELGTVTVSFRRSGEEWICSACMQ